MSQWLPGNTRGPRCDIFVTPGGQAEQKVNKKLGRGWVGNKR